LTGKEGARNCGKGKRAKKEPLQETISLGTLCAGGGGGGDQQSLRKKGRLRKHYRRKVVEREQGM